MQAFAYLNPTSVADATQAVSGGRFLAGGQSLLAAMKLGLATPESLVDLGRVSGLKGITASADKVSIRAMTTHAEVAASADVQRAIPALAFLAGEIGDRQVRNRGTIGGSLANNDPAADYPAAALALGATIETDQRSISADDFFKGLYETALREGEMITAVHFPVPERAGYQKFKQPASRFAAVGVFVAKGPAGVRVAVTGAKACVFRVPALEAKLQASWDTASCAGVYVSPADMTTDLHGTGEYRASLIPVLAGRAVAAS